jgi:hypothetical protein
MTIDRLFAYLRERKAQVKKDLERKVQLGMSCEIQIGELLSIEEIKSYLLHTDREITV